MRVSFGYMSTKKDADRLLEMVQTCFAWGASFWKIPRNYITEEKAKECSDLKPETFDNTGINDCQGILQQIHLYPIKSCGAFSVTKRWPLTSTGLKYDRKWMLINSSGVAITQKHHKKMCLIQPAIDLERNMLILSYPGWFLLPIYSIYTKYFTEHTKIEVVINNETPVENSAFLCQSKVCNDKIQGWDCGDEVAEWLTNVLGSSEIRLLKQCSEDDDLLGRTSKNSKSRNNRNNGKFYV